MTCSKPGCGGEIHQGDEYVAITRQTERLERKFFRTAVTVRDADVLAAYHPACAPTI